MWGDRDRQVSKGHPLCACNLPKVVGSVRRTWSYRWKTLKWKVRMFKKADKVGNPTGELGVWSRSRTGTN